MNSFFEPNIKKYKKSSYELAEEFIDCYGTIDKKSGCIRLDIDDVPFDQRELYAQARIRETNNNEWATESSDIYDSILCVVGNELNIERQDEIIDSIKSQAVSYHEEDLLNDIAIIINNQELSKPACENEHVIDHNKNRMLASEMVGC